MSAFGFSGLVVLELDKMVLFCIVFMKRLKLILSNSFWSNKGEKSMADAEKEKQRKGVFLVNNREYFALSHFTFANKN